MRFCALLLLLATASPGFDVSGSLAPHENLKFTSFTIGSAGDQTTDLTLTLSGTGTACSYRLIYPKVDADAPRSESQVEALLISGRVVKCPSAPDWTKVRVRLFFEDPTSPGYLRLYADNKTYTDLDVAKVTRATR